MATLSSLAAKIMKPEYCSLISFFAKDLHPAYFFLDFRTLNVFKILVADYLSAKKTTP